MEIDIKLTGVIAEYDPFHNGHALQLASLRAMGAGPIVVCMSSGAVQRGGVPLFPEPVRVRAALEAGADLVIALPGPYACAGAEAFAAAGVHLLSALGCERLAFGAETPDAARLMEAARLLQSDALAARLRENLATGQTFAAARAAAAEALCPGMAALLSLPNNILGVEYCKAILAQDSPMTPLPMPRLGAGHGAAEPGNYNGAPVASASHLRAAVRRGGVEALEPFVPPAAFGQYRAAAARGELANPERFGTAVLTLLRFQTAADFAAVRGVGEGLEYRLANAVQAATDVEALYTRLKTRRYPHARLRRLVLDAALGIRAAELTPLPNFIHVLGARRDRMSLLRQAGLPASTSLAKLERAGGTDKNAIRLYNKTSDFSSLCRNRIMPMGLAYTAKSVLL